MPFPLHFVILASAICSWLCIHVFMSLFCRLLIDIPNSRSSHIRPTPRGGGIVFILLSSIASATTLFVYPHSFIQSNPLLIAPLLLLPLGIIGFIDDFVGLPVGLRYAVQVITAFFIVFLSSLVPLHIGSLFLWIFLVVSVTAVINFTNFMDGIDGLVAGCMLVSYLAVAFKLSLPYPVWVFFGSLFGFLVLNWSPAKIFMGDVGSTCLGALFAFLVLQANNWPDTISFLLVSTPLLGDAFVCVLRRLISRQPIFKAHRLHLFQRLHQAGWSHSHVSILYIVATLCLAFALMFTGLLGTLVVASLLFLLGVWLDRHVAVPFAIAASRT